jgi:hypothetical protein
LPQSQLVTHECIANAQAIINISRKRLCAQASRETNKAWKLVLDAVKKELPELYNVCVPECIYRGFCPELNSCGWPELMPLLEAKTIQEVSFDESHSTLIR